MVHSTGEKKNINEVIGIDPRRAQEIANDQTMKNVTYNGEMVYIEHVDQERGVATIHPLNEPNVKQTVSVQELTEE